MLANRQDIRAVVGVQHLGPKQVKLDQTARDGVAVGGALALLVDIRLDGQALAGVILAVQILADRHHRQRGLMAEPGRLAGQVAIV